MQQDELNQQLQELVLPLCEAQGLSLWGIDLLFGGGSKYKVVRIYVDTEEGVTVNQCAEFSRQLGLVLDVEEVIPGRYTLEVSSPGLERPFFRADQLPPYVGEPVRLQLHVPREGRKKFSGTLLSVRGESFVLGTEAGEFEFQWTEVKKMHLVFIPVKGEKKSKPAK
jgi:ribosome maturation factor RimP